MARLVPMALPSVTQPVIDRQTGLVTRPWYTFFQQLATTVVQGPIAPVVDGDPVVWDGTTGRLVKD